MSDYVKTPGQGILKSFWAQHNDVRFVLIVISILAVILIIFN